MPARKRTTDTLTCSRCGLIFPYKQSGRNANRFCSWGCLQASRAPEGRFWSKVDKNGPIPTACPERGPCWCWIGALFTDSGYGQFWFNGTNRRAHVVAYEWANGPVPEGLIVRHHCDNPVCVRPSHLEAGTHKQNAEDRDSRGRGVSGDRHWTRRTPERVKGLPGERNAMARLTEDDVRDILRQGAAGKRRQEIADEKHVSIATVYMILRRDIWRHVTLE